MTVLLLSLRIVIFIAVGFVARKLKVMPDGFDKMLSRFVMAIPLPCMIINSFNLEFSMGELLNAPLIMGLSVLSMAVTAIPAQLIYLWFRKAGKTGLGKSIRFALLFTNFTFFGFPVVDELYGTQGSFYYVIFTLPVRLVFYGGAGFLLGQGVEKLDYRELAKRFFCEPVIAVFIGFFLYVTQIPVPDVLRSVLTSLGNMASPLGLMLCGTIIADAQWKGISRYPSVFWASAARLLLMPALVLGLFSLLHIEPLMARTMVCYFAMPVASFLPAFCLSYNPSDTDARIAGGYLVVVSTVMCVATIPLWALLLDRFSG